MATVNLEPNADVSNSPAWTLSTGSDVYALIDEDHTGAPHTDSLQIYTTAAGKKCVVQFDDFDSTGVASIDSVQAVLRVANAVKGQIYVVGMTIGNNGTGNANWAEEYSSESASRDWETVTFTSRTTSTSGGSAWTDTDVDNLTMEIHAVAMSGGTFRVTYAYFIVTYGLAPGYKHDVLGVDSGDISTINGIATADISKVSGV